MFRPVLAGALVSAVFVSGCATTATAPAPVAPAFAETAPVGSGEDAADDPAIWVHPERPEASLVLGTDKQAGLYVYDLSGAAQAFLPAGELNNVDLRQGLAFSPGADLAAATNRTTNAVTLFSIDRATGTVTGEGEFPVAEEEPYGLCVGALTPDALDVFVTFKTGLVAHFRVVRAETLSVVERIGEIKLETQLEGCVVDEDQSALFIGEENRGVWRVDVTADGAETARTLIDSVGSETGLVHDVEGVSLYREADGGGYLVVSAQGGDRYVVYDRAAPNAFVGAFSVGRSADGSVDRATHTDGLDVSSAPLGPNFPAGLLVVQDDENTRPAAAQNFKLVDWRAVMTALEAE